MPTEKVEYLNCMSCGKQVSSGFRPEPVEGFTGLVVRAWVECPECIEKRANSAKEEGK